MNASSVISSSSLRKAAGSNCLKTTAVLVQCKQEETTWIDSKTTILKLFDDRPFSFYRHTVVVRCSNWGIWILSSHYFENLLEECGHWFSVLYHMVCWVCLYWYICSSVPLSTKYKIFFQIFWLRWFIPHSSFLHYRYSFSISHCWFVLVTIVKYQTCCSSCPFKFKSRVRSTIVDSCYHQSYQHRVARERERERL